MQKRSNFIDEILTKIQKNIQTNNIDLQDWENYFKFYYQASNTMALDLQSLSKLNKILLNATVIGFKTLADETRYKLENEFLKDSLSKLNSTLDFFNNAFDDNGFLKPEWVMTEAEKKKMLYNTESSIIENSSVKR